jgi:hypothetical protein
MSLIIPILKPHVFVASEPLGCSMRAKRGTLSLFSDNSIGTTMCMSVICV